MIVEELTSRRSTLKELTEYNAGQQDEVSPDAIHALEFLTAPEGIFGGLGRITLGRLEQYVVPSSTGALTGRRYPSRTVERVQEDSASPDGVYVEYVPL